MTTLGAIVNTESVQPLAVVTVTFSPGHYLDDFLNSLEEATTLPTTVVLADNGSTDGVPEAAAAQRENVAFVDTGGNLGYGGGMNAGARWAREHGANEEFLLLANPDVTFAPGSVDKLIECARRHPEAAAIGPLIVEPDGSYYPSAREIPTLLTGIGHALFGAIWPSNPWSAAYQRGEDMDRERTAGWLSGSCVLVRWQAFEEIGGFDERYFMYMEDVDLGDRFRRAGWSNVLCPEAVITHAKGHSTEAHKGAMLRAHHASAYRFQADRHPQWYKAPLRWALRAGLGLRGFALSSAARRQQ
ncbi:glycosyltransferase family 2 protein [Corynebacterium sp.]|uniref:glycosyltransferase family 2 protein n=1 Tax=Corynebacterium sp. TaxID=1720 RepID=UPI0026DD9C89|nr:glycosyltransferase family 2 protein [Corynebacterium sp.]MDO5032123.1 glycosyltransferase family 2 protein [Corynebacterium sp.]